MRGEALAISQGISFASQFETYLRNLNANFQEISQWRFIETPSNFLGFTIIERDELITLAIRGRFAVTYVMPEGVLSQILANRRSLRRINKCLLTQNSQITNFILREIQSVPHDHYEEFRFLILKSISAFHGRHFEASQSLATVVLDSFAYHLMGKKIVTKIKYGFPKPDIEQLETFQPYFRHSVLAPISAAFSHTTKLGAYSRNMTVHSASLSTINQMNALKSILLVSSLYLLSYHDSELFQSEK